MDYNFKGVYYYYYQYYYYYYLVLYSLFELSKGVICPDCGNDFISVNRHQWKCKGKLQNIHSTTKGNHGNNILHCTIENPPNSLVNLNNGIDSNHSEGHLISYDENKNKNNLIMNLRVIAGKSVKVSRDLEHINVPVLHQI